MTKVQSWEVEVRVNGESVLTIGGGRAAHIAGDTDIDSDVVRNAAEHLLAFVGQPQSPWQPIEMAPFISAKRYLIVNESEIPLIGFRYYEHGPWYDEHGHEVSPLAWQELPSYSSQRNSHEHHV